MHHLITPGAVVQTADQIELRVRAREGNVAELEAFDGSFVGFRHVSSLICLPPAAKTAPAQRLAAAADAGQGGGIDHQTWCTDEDVIAVGRNRHVVLLQCHACGIKLRGLRSALTASQRLQLLELERFA